LTLLIAKDGCLYAIKNRWFVNLLSFFMVKFIKNVVVCAVFASALVVIPFKSQAGVFQDIWNSIFGDNHHHHNSSTPPPVAGNHDPVNAVPLDNGMLFLAAAGLALGAKLLFDRRKRAGEIVQ
jgi:hypothetical protein